jgi:WD40 repeat protein
LWWALPVVPRAAMQLPVGTTLFCLGSDDDTAILSRESTGATDNDVERVTLELVEVPSLRPIKMLLANSPAIAIVGASVDRHTMICERNVDGHTQFLRVQLPAGDVREIPLPDSKTASFAGIRLSPDGRFLALPIWDHGSAVQIWVVSERRVYATVRGIHDPVNFSPDSRYLAARVEDGEKNKVRAIDLQTLTTQRTFVGPPTSDICSVAVSDQGRFVIAQLNSNRLLCWNMDTGESETAYFDPATSQGTASSAKLLIVHESAWADSILRCLELAKPLAEPLRAYSDLRVSPDGRIVISATDIPEPLWRTWLRKLRIRTPFAGDYDYGATFVDLRSGQPAGFVPLNPRALNKPARSLVAEWSGSGKTVAVTGRAEPERIGIYDFPPRKSLTWFSAGVAMFALPIALVGWWRARKLRAA